MARKLKYKGEEVAKINEKGQVEFIKGEDLNPLIDNLLAQLETEALDDGTVVLSTKMPSLDIKLDYMVRELGFELVGEDK